MRLLRMLVVSLGLACAWAAGAEAGQDVVRLRSDCLDEAPPACFTDSGSLMTWLWGTRNPSAASPVLVDIGPGEFTRLDCPSGMGHVTFRGSGQDNTVIRGGAKSPSNPQNPSYGIVTPQTMGFGASSVLGMALGGQITPGSPSAGCSNVSV